MSSYTYVKAPPIAPRRWQQQAATNRWLDKLRSLMPTIMITLGASLLISIGYPIASYELTVARKIKKPSILSPVVNNDLTLSESGVDPVLAQQQPLPENTVADYTKLSSWFNFSRPQNIISSNITNYTITIPKLRIKDAVVTIGGDDLNKSLIHYGGTANPGEPGSPVIFGHSILPQFYNPKSYTSIFSLLPSLDKGDEIIVNFDGITYKYVVYDYYEVGPDDIDILEQQYDRKGLTLVTCVPPGTYWRRGIIKARLSN